MRTASDACHCPAIDFQPIAQETARGRSHGHDTVSRITGSQTGRHAHACGGRDLPDHQMLWVLISTALTTLAYKLVQREQRARKGGAAQ
ncbi:hypothetical protein XF35_36715 [Streptomyces platensis subsp. clarensis]|nr:hypothetical protein [Streptomyces platensis subsp. clarensis]